MFDFRYLTSILGFVVLLHTGCTGTWAESGNTSDGQQWVATTGHIADALRAISSGTDSEVTALCGPGMDPHSYAASTSDISRMIKADAIFYNGFHLEAKLHELLHDEFGDKSWSMASAFPEEAKLDWEEDGEIDSEAPFDPHIWNHLPAWAECVEELINQVCKIDPENAATYKSNGAAYVADIRAMHEKAVEQFSAIPKESRILVSAHDAFNYFAKVYDFETVAVLGIGNDAEADVKTIREVATKVCEKKVPVIFLESITNPKVTQALQEACEARQWKVEIAEQPLYSDDLGSEPPCNTFLGAFASNVQLLHRSLKR